MSRTGRADAAVRGLLLGGTTGGALGLGVTLALLSRSFGDYGVVAQVAVLFLYGTCGTLAGIALGTYVAAFTMLVLVLAWDHVHTRPLVTALVNATAASLPGLVARWLGVPHLLPHWIMLSFAVVFAAAAMAWTPVLLAPAHKVAG